MPQRNRSHQRRSTRRGLGSGHRSCTVPVHAKGSQLQCTYADVMETAFQRVIAGELTPDLKWRIAGVKAGVVQLHRGSKRGEMQLKIPGTDAAKWHDERVVAGMADVAIGEITSSHCGADSAVVQMFTVADIDQGARRGGQGQCQPTRCFRAEIKYEEAALRSPAGWADPQRGCSGWVKPAAGICGRPGIVVFIGGVRQLKHVRGAFGDQ